MTIQQNTRPAPADDSTPDSGWVGPCGCAACDKWTDCDYCYNCSGMTEAELDAEMERIREENEYWAEYEENQRPFSEWLFGDED